MMRKITNPKNSHRKKKQKQKYTKNGKIQVKCYIKFF